MLSGLHKFMDYVYNRDDYLSFGGESVKLLLRFVRYVLSLGILVSLKIYTFSMPPCEISRA